MELGATLCCPLLGWPHGAQNPDLAPLSSANMSQIRAALWAEKSEMQKSEGEALPSWAEHRRHEFAEELP